MAKTLNFEQELKRLKQQRKQKEAKKTATDTNDQGWRVAIPLPFEFTAQEKHYFEAMMKHHIDIIQHIRDKGYTMEQVFMTPGLLDEIANEVWPETDEPKAH